MILKIVNVVSYVFTIFIFHSMSSFSDKIPTTCFDPVAIEESPSGAAKFFVVVGVFAMLYTIAAVVWYVVLEAKYIQFEIVSLVVSFMSH